MRSSKLARLFFSLSKLEHRALKKFVRSPYYNKRGDVVSLFDYLVKIDPSDYKSLQKEVVYAKVFPKEKYNSDKFDYAMSFLLKSIEQFLIEQRTSRDALKVQIAMVQEYRRLGLPKHFAKAFRYAQKKHLEQPYRDTRFHRYDFRLEVEQYEFESEQQRSVPTNLQTLNNKLDLQYIAQKLRHSCLSLAHQSVYKTEYDTGLLDMVFLYIEQTPKMLEYPAISLYYYYYKAVTSPEKEAFYQKFKPILFAETDRFAHAEMRDLYLLAINYCVKKSNEGQQQYYQELFDLFRVGIEKNILMDNDGRLHHFTFKNAVRMAVRLKELDWASNFVEDYEAYIDPLHQDAYVNYAKAEILVAKKEYQTALVLLQQIDYKDLQLNLGAKMMLLKIYYALDEYDVLESFLSSFQTFIRRKDVLGYHRENYKNIIKFTQKVLTISPYNKKAQDQLREQIETTKPLTEKAWLLQQLDQV
ncbi:MAG: hypothetical protein GY810_11675 [Aureispira sp.]|nr:hypothetical protein [Aureispira sp.]